MLLAVDFDNLHQVLRVLYDEMMPLCGNMTGVAKGIAGLGALFYVAAKVWQSLARAEAIDVYPLLRPFALGLCIMFFPTFVLGTINTVLSPIVKGCSQLMETQTFDMNEYRAQKDRLEYEALMRSPETAYLASDEEFDRQLEELGWSPSDMVTMTGMYMDRAAYNIKKSVRDWFRELLEILFQAAGLIIDTLRTFFLIVLSILGPLAFALSVYDGFQSTLTQWISRYISIYLPELHTGREQYRVCNLYDYRHRGLLHRSDSGRLDCVSRGYNRIQPQPDTCGRTHGCGGGCGNRKDCRKTSQITNFNF